MIPFPHQNWGLNALKDCIQTPKDTVLFIASSKQRHPTEVEYRLFVSNPA